MNHLDINSYFLPTKRLFAKVSAKINYSCVCFKNYIISMMGMKVISLLLNLRDNAMYVFTNSIKNGLAPDPNISVFLYLHDLPWDWKNRIYMIEK